MRVLVCGSRDWDNQEAIVRELSGLELSLIIEGGAKGADWLAKEYAKFWDVPVLSFKAEWERYGRAAGPKRNQRMLDEGKPDLVLAFHEGIEFSRGTKDMVTRAKKAGVPVKLFLE